jgi:xylulokinase
MGGNGYLLGFDVGSSFIKAALIDSATGKLEASASAPEAELAIAAPRAGWAEQDPAVWWENVAAAARLLRSKAGRAFESVAAIGISYQMHGLVLVDRAGAVLRPSIIWCDSRAVQTGEKALRRIGAQACLSRLLNSPGNFTASKLAWVKENEPEVFRRAAKAMLPGDYVAFRMTGDIRTTPSGLSEGILWDFPAGARADIVLDAFGLSPDLLPEVVPTFSVQGTLTAGAAADLGLKKGIPVSYRAGDQPNNAFSLKVLDPGEAATTAGTSGVVYGVAGAPTHDPRSRVNTFVHVTHAAAEPRYGVLMCLNGTGILYRWLRSSMAGAGAPLSYEELNRQAGSVPVGCDGLTVLPYGNGAERTLENRTPGALVAGLDFNRHGPAHLVRAAQEGIVFALRYGLEIMAGMGIEVRTVRAGDANMFLSPVFREAFATATGARVELYRTDGAQGAARGAGAGAGIYPGPREAFAGLSAVMSVDPDPRLAGAYAEAYARWKEALDRALA